MLSALSRRLQRVVANLPELPIHHLAQRHDGLTEALAEMCTGAARVCLDRHHRPPTEFNLHGANGVHTAAVVEWQQADERMQKAYGNEIEATEFGACAFVLATVELVDGLVAIGRADTGTGADYYMAPKGTTIEDLEGFEDVVRLEVSGVDRGSESAVNQRLKRSWRRHRRERATCQRWPALQALKSSSSDSQDCEASD